MELPGDFVREIRELLAHLVASCQNQPATLQIEESLLVGFIGAVSRPRTAFARSLITPRYLIGNLTEHAKPHPRN
jgi:hypothetical protein